MNWTIILKWILPLFGQVLTTYLLPLLNEQVKQPLERILPIAERWVAAVETTGMSGTEKRIAAAAQIIKQLQTDEGLIDVERGLVDTAIQLAWINLGLNKTGTVAK